MSNPDWFILGVIAGFLFFPVYVAIVWFIQDWADGRPWWQDEWWWGN